MIKVLTYEKFILEAAVDNSAEVSKVVNELQRSYDSLSTPSVVDKDVELLSETRKWPVFLSSAKPEINKDASCKYYVKVAMFSDVYELEIHFDVTYKGILDYETSSPDMIQDEDKELGVSLEKLKLTRLAMKSDTIKFNETAIIPDLRKSVYGLLLTILKSEFTVIRDEELIIRQL